MVIKRLYVAAPEVPWQKHALCRAQDPEVFFPEHGNQSTARARSVCSQCPVQRECLEYALENDEQFGIYAGTTAQDRRKLLRRRAGARPA